MQIILVFLCVLLIMVCWRIFSNYFDSCFATEKPDYTREESLFTPAEAKFLHVLDEAVGSKYRVFGKVRIADVVGVSEHFSGSERQKRLSRITSKHLDFVLCDPDTLSPVCALELDDSSHQRQNRIDRDEFVDNTLRTAGIPLIRVPVKQKYDMREISGLIPGL